MISGHKSSFIQVWNPKPIHLTFNNIEISTECSSYDQTLKFRRISGKS